MPETVGVRELKNNTSRVIRSVREEMAEYVVTLHGEPVAILRPLTDQELDQLHNANVDAEIAAMKALAKQVGAAMGSETSLVQLVDEQRR
jgi:prevent-host-death family protein